MRIGVMLRHFKQQPGGIGTYTNNLLDHLVKLDAVNQYIFIYNDENLGGSYSEYPNVEEVAIGSLTKLTWDQIAIPSVVRSKHLDLIFNPKVLFHYLPIARRFLCCTGAIGLHFPKTTTPWTGSTTGSLRQCTAKGRMPWEHYPILTARGSGPTTVVG